jgi:hypothetical protein
MSGMPTLATLEEFEPLNQSSPRPVYLGGTVGQSAACIGAAGICPLIIQWTVEGADPPGRGARWGLGTMLQF